MGRISTKEDKTVYQLAREEKELSREKAAEITGLSTTTIDFGTSVHNRPNIAA